MNRRFSPQLVSLRIVSLPVLLVCSIVLLTMITAMAQVQPDLPPGVAAPPIIAPGAPAL